MIAQTRRDIMGHESTSMDDRYTMIGDEDLRVATEKMKALAGRRSSPPAVETADRLKEIEPLKARIQELEARGELKAAPFPISATNCATNRRQFRFPY